MDITDAGACVRRGADRPDLELRMRAEKTQQLTAGVAAGARDCSSHPHRMSMHCAAKSCQLDVGLCDAIRDESGRYAYYRRRIDRNDHVYVIISGDTPVVERVSH